MFSSEYNWFDLLLLKLERKRSQLLPENRVKAIAEELAGFILTHVLDDFGEFHYVEQ